MLNFVSELSELKLALYLSPFHLGQQLSKTHVHMGPPLTEAQQALCPFVPAVISSYMVFSYLSRCGCPFLILPSIPLPSRFFFLLTDEEVGLVRTEEPGPDQQQSRKSLPGKPYWRLWTFQPVLSESIPWPQVSWTHFLGCVGQYIECSSLALPAEG